MSVNYKVVRTPIDTINILGAGGIKQGTISEIYGIEKSGKSTLAYQTGGYFLNDNRDSVLHIIDVENSVDYTRLRDAFRIPLDRVKVHKCRTLETAFETILQLTQQLEHQYVGGYKVNKKEYKLKSKADLLKMTIVDFVDYCEDYTYTNNKDKEIVIAKLYDVEDELSSREVMLRKLFLAGAVRGERTPIKENGEIVDYDESTLMIPMMVIWDTIAVSKPKIEVEAALKGEGAVNAGGIGLKARVIEQYCCTLLAQLQGRPITIFILNQIRMDLSGYMPKETSSGGNALKHACHYRFHFKRIDNKEARDKTYQDDIEMKVGTISKLSIQKNKFSSITQDLEVYINDIKGGIFIASEELPLLALKLGILKNNRGWFTFPDDEEIGKFRWSKSSDSDNFISSNPEIRRYLLDKITKHYRMSYLTLNTRYKEEGLDHIGHVTDEELEEIQLKLINEQNILDDMMNNAFV